MIRAVSAPESPDLTIEKLVQRGYPASIRQLPYDPHFVIRGLTVDKQHGNILKLDRHNHVARAMHVRDPRVRFAIAVAPSIPRAGIERAIAEAGLPALLSLQVFEGRTYELIRAADWVIDLGPGGGPEGGRLVAEGTPDQVAASDGATGRFLARALR